MAGYYHICPEISLSSLSGHAGILWGQKCDDFGSFCSAMYLNSSDQLELSGHSTTIYSTCSSDLFTVCSTSGTALQLKQDDCMSCMNHVEMTLFGDLSVTGVIWGSTGGTINVPVNYSTGLCGLTGSSTLQDGVTACLGVDNTVIRTTGDQCICNNLTIYDVGSEADFNMRAYSNLTSHTASINFGKSSCCAQEVLFGATVNNDVLGELTFSGTNSAQDAFAQGANIYAKQNGIAGDSIPADLYLTTCGLTTNNSCQLVLHNSGSIGIGTTDPDTDYLLHVAGDVKADNILRTCLNCTNEVVVVSGVGGPSGARMFASTPVMELDTSNQLVCFTKYSEDCTSPNLKTLKTRGTGNIGIGTTGLCAVKTCDDLFVIDARGYDGSGIQSTGKIKFSVDTYPAGGTSSGVNVCPGQMPTSLTFYTGSAATSEERLNIDSCGCITFNNAYSFPLTSENADNHTFLAYNSSVSALEFCNFSNVDWTLYSSNVTNSIVNELTTTEYISAFSRHLLNTTPPNAAYCIGYHLFNNNGNISIQRAFQAPSDSPLSGDNFFTFSTPLVTGSSFDTASATLCFPTSWSNYNHTIDLSGYDYDCLSNKPSITNTYVTGGVFDNTTNCITFRCNNGNAFTVDISGYDYDSLTDKPEHDNLVGFVANEHIDHTSVSFNGIKGIEGGGDISSSRTFCLSGQALCLHEASFSNSSLLAKNSSGTFTSVTTGSVVNGSSSIPTSNDVFTFVASVSDQGNVNIDHSTVSFAGTGGIDNSSLGDITTSRTVQLSGQARCIHDLTLNNGSLIAKDSNGNYVSVLSSTFMDDTNTVYDPWVLSASDTTGCFTVDSGCQVSLDSGSNICITRSNNVVTIHNLITNNNQLTNGCSYCTTDEFLTGGTFDGVSATFTSNCNDTFKVDLSGYDFTCSSNIPPLLNATSSTVVSELNAVKYLSVCNGLVSAFGTYDLDDYFSRKTDVATATATEVTVTLTGLSGDSSFALGDTFNIGHDNTSSQASITSSSRTYIDSVTLDDYGHVTGLTTATETAADGNVCSNGGVADYLPLWISGAAIGNSCLCQTGTTIVSKNDLCILGNLTVQGDTTTVNTTVTATSAMCIQNDGTGPALQLNQTGSQPIVDFQDDGTSAFYIEDGGNVGIGTNNPNTNLTVVCNISASTLLYDGNNNSSQWTDAYNNYITGIQVSGTCTKTITLTQRDGGTITANFTDNDTVYTHPPHTAITCNCSNGIVLQDISVNSCGHVTSVGACNLDDRYYTESEVDTCFSTCLDNYLLNTTDTLSGTLETFNSGDSSCVSLIPSGGSPYVLLNRTGSNSWKIKATGNGSAQTLDTSLNDTSIFTIEAGGNVGIGTINPNTTLTVSGSISASSTICENGKRVCTAAYPTVGSGCITISAGTDLDTGGDFNVNQAGATTITIDHSNISRTDTTSTASPVNGGTVSVIDSITSNSRGHITAANVKTITLPSDASTLDGIDSVAFIRTNSNNAVCYQDSNGYPRITHSNGSAQLGLFRSGTSAGGGYIGADCALMNFYDSGFGKCMCLNLTTGQLCTDNQGILWGADNDGANSGLHADLLDGQHGSYYARKACWPDVTTQLGCTVHSLTNLNTTGLWSKPAGYSTMVRAVSSEGLPTDHGQSYFGYTITSRRDTGGGYSALLTAYDNSELWFTYQGSCTSYPTWRRIWHDNNDGSGSGLDADLLDGQEGTYYLNYNNFTNTPTIPTVGNGTITISAGTDLSTGGNFTVNQAGASTITIDHSDITRTDTSDSATATAGGTIAVIDSITSNARGHITAANVKTITLPSNAANADTVDSLHASSFVRSDTSDTVSGATYTFDSTSTNVKLYMCGHAGAASYNYFLNASNDGGVKAVHFVNGSTRTADGGANAYTIRNDGGPFILGRSTYATCLCGSALTYNGNTVWHAGNDGAGSGLHADCLDGQEGAYYLNYNNFTNTPTIPTNTTYSVTTVDVAGSAAAKLRLTASDSTTDDITFAVNQGLTIEATPASDLITITGPDLSSYAQTANLGTAAFANCGAFAEAGHTHTLANITDAGTAAAAATTDFAAASHSHSNATTSASGFVELATNAEVTTGTSTTRVITPSSLTSITKLGTIATGTWQGAAIADAYIASAANWNACATSSHTHTLANITDAGTAAACAVGDFALAGHNHSGVYDNYGDWNLLTNGTHRADITTGASVNFIAGSNVTLSYCTGSGNCDVVISATDTNTNNYVNSVAFATGTGVLTLGRSGLADLTIDLDGRYCTSDTNTNYYVNSVAFATGTGVLTLGRSGLTDLTIDLDGRYCTTDTNTTYGAGNCITIVSGDINHADTSTQAGCAAGIPNRKFIKAVGLDDYGHVCALSQSFIGFYAYQNQVWTNFGDSTSQCVEIEGGTDITISTNGDTAICVSYSGTSDYRQKYDIEPFDSGYDIVNNVDVYSYKLKDDCNNEVRNGMMAHELQEAGQCFGVYGVKDGVDKKNNPEYQKVEYPRLIPTLWSALKTAMCKIEDLETRLATLELQSNT
jgi:hypothetical protein